MGQGEALENVSIVLVRYANTKAKMKKSKPDRIVVTFPPCDDPYEENPTISAFFFIDSKTETVVRVFRNPDIHTQKTHQDFTTVNFQTWKLPLLFRARAARKFVEKILEMGYIEHNPRNVETIGIIQIASRKA